MKVVQLFQSRLVKSLTLKRVNQFAQLAKESDADDDVTKYTNAKEYYEYLLRFTAQDERGYVKFKSGQFTKMVRMAKNEEDIKCIRDAFYNYIGHKETFTNSQVDKYLEKAIELNAPAPLHEILINHNYLMYYPQPNILHALAQHYIKQADAQGLKELTSIYANSHFLKIQPETLEAVSTFAIQQKNQEIILNAAQIAYKKIVTVSENTINNVLAGIARHKIANPEPKEGTGNRVETKFLAHIKKCSQSYHTIIGKAYLSLANKDIDGALVNLANYHQVKESTANIISNDALTIEFFEQLQAKIAESHKPKYAERLAKVTSDIQQKLGKQAIHSDVYDIITKTTAVEQQSAETISAETTSTETTSTETAQEKQ